MPRYPISGATPAVQIYIFDEPARIQAELSASLPRGEDAAAEFAQAQVQGAWREEAQLLTRAYRGLLKAKQYGVLRLGHCLRWHSHCVRCHRPRGRAQDLPVVAANVALKVTMKPMRVRLMTFVLCNVVGTATRAPALDISTDEIAALSLSPACLDYQITGVCLFLICDLFECSIETTPRISHFLPDVVVSSYQRTGENPWAEMAGLGAAGAGAVAGLLGATAGLLVEGGHQREGTRIEAHENVRFKETDVIIRSFRGPTSRWPMAFSVAARPNPSSPIFSPPSMPSAGA